MSKHLEVPSKPEHVTQPRTDLRPPAVQFGRCLITGEWGAVVALDLGDLTVNSPITTEGVEFDQNGQPVFTKWQPHIFETSATFSKQGLEMLLKSLADQDVPVPPIKPPSAYMWQLLMASGAVIPQFSLIPGTEEFEERHTGGINWADVKQISLVPFEKADLPTFTYNVETDQFYRAGALIDVDYGQERPANALPYAKRHVSITTASAMGAGLARNVGAANITVNQWIGWETPDKTRACIIAVDERGGWRPLSYK